MDPLGGGGLAESIRQLAAGRTAIVITHRFTTARFADVIHVIRAAVLDPGHDDPANPRWSIRAGLGSADTDQILNVS